MSRRHSRQQQRRHSSSEQKQSQQKPKPKKLTSRAEFHQKNRFCTFSFMIHIVSNLDNLKAVCINFV